MGIYVHPLTKDTAVLEQLAGVPQGTSARLRAIESNYPYHLTDAAQEKAMFDAVVADEELKSLWHFELFGWGLISAALYAAVGNDGDYCCGTVRTPATVVRFVSLQAAAIGDVPIAKLGGIGWG